jgi:hypothetical protein
MAGVKGMRKGNQRELLTQRLRREFPGYFAVVKVARAAHEIEEEAFRRKEAGEGWIGLLMQSAKLHTEVAKYQTPQLKAVDLSSAGEGLSFSLNIGKQSDSKAIKQEKVIDVVNEVVEEVIDNQ